MSRRHKTHCLEDPAMLFNFRMGEQHYDQLIKAAAQLTLELQTDINHADIVRGLLKAYLDSADCGVVLPGQKASEGKS